MYTLGISCYYHNSAAAILHNGKIIAAVDEERFSRQKFDDKILEITELFGGGRPSMYEEITSEISSGKFSSPGFDVQLWDNEAELHQKINARLEDVVKSSGGKTSKEKSSQDSFLDLVEGLYNG